MTFDLVTSDLGTTDAAPPGITPAAGAPPSGLAGVVAGSLQGRELLTHPFYRRWEAGELVLEELAEYAVNYRAFEAALPAVLTAVASDLRDGGESEAAALVEENLADELGRPEPHLALFDRFAAALPARRWPRVRARPPRHWWERTSIWWPRDRWPHWPAWPPMRPRHRPSPRSKSDGLRRWYGLDDAGREFWDVHARMDADHGEWVTDALALLGADPTEVADAARRGADAWWALLDERQSEAPGSAELCSHH